MLKKKKKKKKGMYFVQLRIAKVKRNLVCSLNERMATELSINPNTIQRAYAELERQGYIYSIQGKGSFVSDGRYLAEGIRKDWEKQFDAAIEEGLRIGVSYQDMIKILEEREGGKADA